MKARTIVLLSSVVIAQLAAAQMAEKPPLQRIRETQLRSANDTAQAALRTFAALVTKENYAAMGFDNPEQVRMASVAAPVEFFIIGLDDLLNYKSGTDPSGLLRNTQTLTYPVVAQGQTRSSLTLRRVGDRWETESFGAPTYARSLDQLRGDLAAKSKRPPSDYFEVRVPALNLVFLGHLEDRRLFLTPLLDAPNFGFKRGGTLPAEEAIQAILPAAREHNRLPT